MTEPSVTRKLGVVSGLFVSCFALAWLISLHDRHLDLASRIGFMSVLICVLSSLTFCWAAFAAYFARKRKWSPRACFLAGWLFAAVGFAFVFAGGSRFLGLGAMFLSMATFAGIICRGLVYPEMTDEEAAAPEPPLSLFQK
jgi:hypothetical protein